MKYSAKIVGMSIEKLVDRTNQDPAIIRKRMNQEPEVFNGLISVCERTAYENGIKDKEVISQIVNMTLFGFFLREELALVSNRVSKEA